MTRRLALVIVSAVVATLLLAGVGTLALATVRARATTENWARDGLLRHGNRGKDHREQTHCCVFHGCFSAQ